MKEYNADVVLSLLLLKKRDTIIEEFYRSMDTFQCFTHFCLEKPEVIASKILSNKDKLEDYIKGLISIYPLSDNILKTVTDKCESIDFNIGEWLDISETIKNMLSYILQVCNSELDSEKEPNAYSLERIEEQRSEHEEEIKALNAQKAEMQKMQEKTQALRKQRDDLKAEVEKLRRDSSERELKNDIHKLEDEKRKINKANQNAIAELRKLENDINDYNTHADTAIQELLKSLADCLKKIPEVDSKNEKQSNR